MDMLALTVFQGIVATVLVIVCLLLMLVILLQKGRGGGLSGAFGGGGGGHSAFGAKTGDVFTWVTVALTGLFVVIAIVGVWVFVPSPIAQQTEPVLQAPDAGEQTAPPAGEANLPAEQPARGPATQPGS